MLKFTIKPGEYFMIGEEIKVAFLGGTQNNQKVLVEAPLSYNIVRGKVLERNKSFENGKALPRFTKEREIPAEKMRKMIAKQKQNTNKSE